MPEALQHDKTPGSARLAHPTISDALGPKPVILVCIDRSCHGHRVLAHAGAFARAIGGELILLRVLAPYFENDCPLDPIDWEVRRREAGAALAELAERGCIEAEIVLSHGYPADEICHQATRCGAELIVLGRFGENIDDIGPTAGIGTTARSVLECGHQQVLLVPENAQGTQTLRRILVPLDGSCWAESALPDAMRLARSSGAEIVLAHIVTFPEFVCPTPPESVDMELRERIMDRNTRAATRYLERQRAMLAEQGVVVRTCIDTGPDARISLLKMLRDHAFDLVVLSARGSGFRHLPGLHFGSVAAHLSLHSATPLLIMRPDTETTRRNSQRDTVATGSVQAASHL